MRMMLHRKQKESQGPPANPVAPIPSNKEEPEKPSLWRRFDDWATKAATKKTPRRKETPWYDRIVTTKRPRKRRAPAGSVIYRNGVMYRRVTRRKTARRRRR